MKKIKNAIENHLKNLASKDKKGLIFLSIFLLAIIFFTTSQFIFPLQTKKVSQKITTFVEKKILEIPFSIIEKKQNISPKNLEIKSNILQAKSAYVYNVTKNIVYFDFHSDLILPLASLTKIMTAVVVLENFNKDEIITVNSDMLLSSTNSDLTIGEKWKIGDLVKFMLITSSNNTANLFGVLARKKEKDLVSLMNKKSKEMNLTNTFFINETGLDETKKAGGSYGTAKDVAVLMNYSLKNHFEYFEPTSKKTYNIISESGIEHHLENTNQEINSISGVTASKTGFTILAGGNLSFMFNLKNGENVVISLLGSTKEGRFSDAEILSKYAINFK